MGFFGKKHTDPPRASHDEAAPLALAPPPPPPPAERRLPPTAQLRFTVDDAIQLMRKLPLDQNPELVVMVIKQTLESLHVRIADVIEDAARKQQGLRERMGEVQSQIEALEREARARRDELGQLEADLSEATLVRDRLVLAEGQAGSAEPREAPVAQPRRKPPLPSVPPGRPPRENEASAPAAPPAPPVQAESDLLASLPGPTKP